MPHTDRRKTEVELKEIAEKIDIVDYIGQYVDLEFRNGDYFGLCPFHEENTPSFSIMPGSQKYYCFGCGAFGDVIDFAREYHHWSTARALYELKKVAGISDGETIIRLSATREAKKFISHKGHKTSQPHAILADDIMDKYERREDKLSVWTQEGISIEELDRFIVRYDAFANRLVHPIRLPDGRIFNIAGRTLDPDFKEKKIRKYTYYYKMGTLDTLFGLYENRDAILSSKEIILFEGAKSVMRAAGYGYKNTAAVLTSHLNPYQTRILISLGVRVVFSFDSDVDPREDAEVKKLKHFVPCEWVRNRDHLLDEKMSPVDAGKDIWESLYKRRMRI